MTDRANTASFVITGGGTGGHVMPALAVARELRARGHSVLFIGTRRGLEAKLVPAEGFPIEWIEIGGLMRVGLRTTLIDAGGAALQRVGGFPHARPRSSRGGFLHRRVRGGTGFARRSLETCAGGGDGAERDPGLYASQAGAICIARSGEFPGDREVVSGSRRGSDRVAGARRVFCNPAKPLGSKLTVLITGGSQGSRTLNRAAQESWPLWGNFPVRLIHQTGSSAYEEFAAGFRASGIDGEISPFLPDMPAAFASADLVVSRAGMSTVSELAAAGKPSILVPLPTAADQHQLRNAEAMEHIGAARVVSGRGVDRTNAWWTKFRACLRVRIYSNVMGEAAGTFAKPGAARGRPRCWSRSGKNVASLTPRPKAETIH